MNGCRGLAQTPLALNACLLPRLKACKANIGQIGPGLCAAIASLEPNELYLTTPVSSSILFISATPNKAGPHQIL